jgi:hypothetical protein
VTPSPTATPLPYSKLLLLLPGEAYDPDSSTLVSGLPLAYQAGDPITLTAQALDANGRVPQDPPTGILLTLSADNDPQAQAAPGPLTAGVARFFPVRAFRVGGSVSFTVLDTGGGISAHSHGLLVLAPSGGSPSLLQLSMRSLAPPAAAQGEASVPMLGLAFADSNANGGFILQGLSLTVEDAQGQPLSGVVGSLSVQGPSGSLGSASASGATVYVPLGGAGTSLAGGESRGLSVTAALAVSSASAFRLALSGVTAQNADPSASVGLQCLPANLPFNSGVVSLRPRDASRSLRTYPNPFHPGHGSLTLELATASSSAYTVQIYTLQGESVRSLAQGMAQAGALTRLAWDGRNGAGYLVNSGVYVAVIQVGGQSLTARIAVLK